MRLLFTPKRSQKQAKGLRFRIQWPREIKSATIPEKGIPRGFSAPPTPEGLLSYASSGGDNCNFSRWRKMRGNTIKLASSTESVLP